MTSWVNAAKEGKVFGSITIENDVDISFSSAIAAKRDENTLVIYAHVTGCNGKFMEKDKEFEPGLYALTVYLNDHTDSYGKERKVFATHRFIAKAVELIDGEKVYFNGLLSASNDRAWKSYETSTDTKGRALPPEGTAALLRACADFELIEGKGELEGKEIPKGNGSYQRKSVSQAEILDQRLTWIKTQYLDGSVYREIASSLNLEDSDITNIVVGWLSDILK